MSVMIYFTGCVKCKGDMRLQQDYYGEYIQCFQCGSISELLTREDQAERRRPKLPGDSRTDFIRSKSYYHRISRLQGRIEKGEL